MRTMSQVTNEIIAAIGIESRDRAILHACKFNAVNSGEVIRILKESVDLTAAKYGVPELDPNLRQACYRNVVAGFIKEFKDYLLQEA